MTDGPFAETKELVAGFWLWQVKSMQEAIEWVKRILPENAPPGGPQAEIEIRPVRARGLRPRAHPRVREAEERLRARAAGNQGR